MWKIISLLNTDLILDFLIQGHVILPLLLLLPVAGNQCWQIEEAMHFIYHIHDPIVSGCLPAWLPPTKLQKSLIPRNRFGIPYCHSMNSILLCLCFSNASSLPDWFFKCHKLCSSLVLQDKIITKRH